LGFGLGWAQGNVFARVHTGATWEIPLNRPSMAAMLPIVKLLLPLILKNAACVCLQSVCRQ